MVRRMIAGVSVASGLALLWLVGVSFFNPPCLVRELGGGKWVAVDVLEGRLRIRTCTLVPRTDAELRGLILVDLNPVFAYWSSNACPLEVPSEQEVREALGGEPLEPQRLPAFMQLIREHESAQATQTGRFIRSFLDVHSRQDQRWWAFEQNTGFAAVPIGLSRRFHPFDEVVMMPLWVIAGVLIAWPATAMLLAWLKRRMRGSGLCGSCGYNLTGNVSGTCPECGVKT